MNYGNKEKLRESVEVILKAEDFHVEKLPALMKHEVKKIRAMLQ